MGCGAHGHPGRASLESGAAVEAPAQAPAERERIANTLAQMPLAFEPNQGQAAPRVKFLTRAPWYLLQLTATEMRMDPATLPRPVVHLVGG